MKLSRCVIIYCRYLLGLQATRRRWVLGKDWEAVAAWDLWRVLPKQGTNDLQLSEEDISGQGFPYHIPLCPQDPPSKPCMFDCVCVLLSKTDTELVLGAESTAGCIPCVSLSLLECLTKCFCCHIHSWESPHNQHDGKIWLAMQNRHDVFCNEK